MAQGKCRLTYKYLDIFWDTWLPWIIPFSASRTNTRKTMKAYKGASSE